MNAAINLLSPQQVDSILAAYDSLALWYAQAADYISDQVSRGIIEDIWM